MDKIKNLKTAKYYSNMRLAFMEGGYDEKDFPEHASIPISQVKETIEEAQGVIWELEKMLKENDTSHGMLHYENAIELQQLHEDILVFRYLSHLGGKNFDNFVDAYLPLYKYRWEREGR